MKIKLSIKQILIVLLLVFSLFGILKPITVHAWIDGNADGLVTEEHGGNVGGPSFARTGWLLMLCDSSSTPYPGSQVVFFPYMGNTSFASCGGAITTSYKNNNATGMITGTPLNECPAFLGCVPGGPIVKAWLMMECPDTTYSCNALYVADQYLGVAIEDIDKELANKELYIQFTPIFWARTQGMTKASKGPWYIGNAYNWAAQNDFPSYIGAYTHRNFPQSSALEFPDWFSGIGAFSAFKVSGDYWSLGEFQSNRR